ncbi:metal-sulfur cluster assembly factor [Myxococcus sp. RHSTA-1-4]|uniref:metal-sulfur cluster assembly factor n=1 Tax=Myxococcus sp. RHSTA-1-4 TaxID=2874601 RepID=UPI001CC177B7|nr:iron-sulfur cluster assembly protein [Myxococcus sp. RHSTA-1-4]MBZ4417530.1 iron-sulfur cluster assembly protein [Myxococcus sp. RHSTA-1-4]
MTEQELRARIQDIPDPCSLATGVPLGIGEMGLIQSLECVEGKVTVRMHITSPMCIMAAYFMREIEQRLTGQEGVASVHVEFDQDLQWTPQDIHPDARERLAAKRITMLGGRLMPRGEAGKCGA